MKYSISFLSKRQIFKNSHTLPKIPRFFLIFSEVATLLLLVLNKSTIPFIRADRNSKFVNFEYLQHRFCKREGRWYKSHAEEPKFVAFFLVLATENYHYRPRIHSKSRNYRAEDVQISLLIDSDWSTLQKDKIKSITMKNSITRGTLHISLRVSTFQ